MNLMKVAAEAAIVGAVGLFSAVLTGPVASAAPAYDAVTEANDSAAVVVDRTYAAEVDRDEERDEKKKEEAQTSAPSFDLSRLITPEQLVEALGIELPSSTNVSVPVSVGAPGLPLILPPPTALRWPPSQLPSWPELSNLGGSAWAQLPSFATPAQLSALPKLPNVGNPAQLPNFGIPMQMPNFGTPPQLTNFGVPPEFPNFGVPPLLPNLGTPDLGPAPQLPAFGLPLPPPPALELPQFELPPPSPPPAFLLLPLLFHF